VLVVSVGNLNFDIYLRAGGIPGPDERVEALELYTGGGGSAANFALAIARMGLRARFIGAVGDDPLGEMSLMELAAGGVDVSRVKRVHGVPSGIVVVIVDESGVKRMLAYRGANALLAPEDLTPEKFEGARHVHVATGRVEIIKRAGGLAREAGASLSVDGGMALAGRGLERLREVLGGADVAFFNYAEARAATGLDDPERIVEALSAGLRVGEVVVTLGAGGAIASDGRRTVRVPAIKAAAVDTTGAGDSFAAAYVAALLRGADMRERLAFASAAAAIKVSRRGARSSPSYDEVVSLLRSLGYAAKI
jgi:ribokinase